MIYDMHNSIQYYTQLIFKNNGYQLSFLEVELKWHTLSKTELVIIGTWRLITDLSIETTIMITPLNQIHYVYSPYEGKQYILSFTVDNMFSLIPMKKEKERKKKGRPESKGIIIGQKIETTPEFTQNFKVITDDIRGKNEMISEGLQYFRPFFLLDDEKELLTTNVVVGSSAIDVIMKADKYKMYYNKKTGLLPYLYPNFIPDIENKWR